MANNCSKIYYFVACVCVCVCTTTHSLPPCAAPMCVFVESIIPFPLRSSFIYGFYLFQKETLLNSDWPHSLTTQPCSLFSYSRPSTVSFNKRQTNANIRLTNAQLFCASNIPVPQATFSFSLALHFCSVPSVPISHIQLSFKLFNKSFSCLFVVIFFLHF